ncbi:MAG: hypothetical protein RIS34_656 [Pseudomonadota bacterium]|jgi:nicotinamide riboside kinase
MATGRRSLKIALLGAESTGKTRLGRELAALFQMQGKSVRTIPESLRDWCTHHGRTPNQTEQLAIAQEQSRRVIDAGDYDVIIADTTPLTTAIYSHWLFADQSIDDFAIKHQRDYDVTLVLGLDLPWVADGHQRDGPQSREPFDELLRKTLELAHIPYASVYGQGAQRSENALAAISHQDLRRIVHPVPETHNGPWPADKTNRFWHCDKCDDAICERHLFRQLLAVVH